MMGTLTALPSAVHADANSIIIYQGQPNRSVHWTLTGSGSIAPFSNYTDETGHAGAKYTPGTVNDVVTVQVTAGA